MGWIARTNISRQGGSRVVAVYAMPVGRREYTLQLYIVARREAAFSKALAIAKSVRTMAKASALPYN